MSETKLKLNLFINKKTQKVVFAEAGGDFVDFLFSLMILPVGSVISLISKDAMVGSLGNLYQSIKDLSDHYMQGLGKGMFLEPKTEFTTRKPRLLLKDTSVPAKRYFTCSSSTCRHYTNVGATYGYCGAVYPTCPTCKMQMSRELLQLTNGTVTYAAVGFVKDAVSFMVMDDLSVTPLSTNTLVKEFNLNNGGPIEAMMVDVGREEGLVLLKAAFQSKTVLTDVFLKK